MPHFTLSSPNSEADSWFRFHVDALGQLGTLLRKVVIPLASVLRRCPIESALQKGMTVLVACCRFVLLKSSKRLQAPLVWDVDT